MKTVTIKCDKCGKDITDHGIVLEYKFTGIHDGVVVSNAESTTETLELCNECKKKIVSCLKGTV